MTRKPFSDQGWVMNEEIYWHLREQISGDGWKTQSVGSAGKGREWILEIQYWVKSQELKAWAKWCCSEWCHLQMAMWFIRMMGGGGGKMKEGKRYLPCMNVGGRKDWETGVTLKIQKRSAQWLTKNWWQWCSKWQWAWEREGGRLFRKWGLREWGWALCYIVGLLKG